MKLNPAGYYIRVSVERVEDKITGGALKGFTLETDDTQKRLEEGHDVGVVEAIGPTAFTGFAGIKDDLPTSVRALQYGIKVGDLVQFTRYDGKAPRHQEDGNYRMIQDQHIVGVYSDD